MKSKERKIALGAATAEIDGNTLKVKGPKGTVEKAFLEKSISIIPGNKEIIVRAANDKRKCKRIMCTVASKIKGLVTVSYTHLTLPTIYSV